jgi:hypothetical protein
MEEASSHLWFLRKHQGGSVFGPISFDQLAGWASSAQVAQQDVVSTDQETWLKAPMVAQLGMDWLVELTSEHYYGPTTVGAIQEFIRLGDINAATFVVNSCDGSRRQIREMPALFKTNVTGSRAGAAEPVSEPAGSRHFNSPSGTHPRSRTNIARRTPRSSRSRAALRKAGRKIQRAPPTQQSDRLDRHLFIR